MKSISVYYPKVLVGWLVKDGLMMLKKFYVKLQLIINEISMKMLIDK
jgi:hypothetical protein